MLVSVGYEQQIHSRIYWYKSLDGVSDPIRVTGFLLSPLGYTRHGLSIQGSRQSCCCKLLLNCSGHVDVSIRVISDV